MPRYKCIDDTHNLMIKGYGRVRKGRFVNVPKAVGDAHPHILKLASELEPEAATSLSSASPIPSAPAPAPAPVVVELPAEPEFEEPAVEEPEEVPSDDGDLLALLEGFETLRASDAIELVKSMESYLQLELAREIESGNKARKTVLEAIDNALSEFEEVD